MSTSSKSTPPSAASPSGIIGAASYRPRVTSAAVGSGSGDWVDGALTDPIPGATRSQSLKGSCVSACGEILSGGRHTERQLLDALGEPSEQHALADALGEGWAADFFDSGSEALEVASRGPMGAVLQSPGSSRHMVVTSPRGDGTFQVLDPWDGTGYIVDAAWIERYVAAGTFRE